MGIVTPPCVSYRPPFQMNSIQKDIQDTSFTNTFTDTINFSVRNFLSNWDGLFIINSLSGGPPDICLLYQGVRLREAQ